MSPLRRSSGEIHILAMLDGRAAIRRKSTRPALRWYGAGALLACTLLGVLTWIAGGAPARDAGPAVTAAALPTARAAAGPDTTPAVRGALIVDMPPPAPSPAPATRAAAVPPDAAANVAPSDAAAGTPAVASVPRAFAHVAPSRAAAPVRPLPPHRVMPRQAPVQPASQPNVRSPSLARIDTPPARHKRSPAMARVPSTQSATIDTDVAVISAILQHTGNGNGNGNGTDGADAVPAVPCGDRPCGPRMPSR